MCFCKRENLVKLGDKAVVVWPYMGGNGDDPNDQNGRGREER